MCNPFKRFSRFSLLLPLPLIVSKILAELMMPDRTLIFTCAYIRWKISLRRQCLIAKLTDAASSDNNEGRGLLSSSVGWVDSVNCGVCP